MEYDLPTGYRPLRTLSERDGSWVYLAINPIGKHCCLKVQRVVDSESLTALRAHRDRLPEITSSEGFIPLVCHGAFPDQGVLWEELALADDSVTGRPFDAARADEYTPLTLALRVAESGPASTTEVIAQGLRLCRALAHLHRQSLYHRDVKPANVLVYQARWVLGDYGSVGEAGTTVEFPGTEGYVPPDGLGSPRLDVFALGRSLYEAWTGLDRFQFPSLPPHVTRSEDWETHGWMLNHALAHAANPLPSARFQSAELLVEALERARRGRKRLSRRAAFTAVGGAAVAVGAAYIWKNLPPYKAVWRKLPPKGFGIEWWAGNQLTCDWSRGVIFSGFSDTRATFLNSYNLKTWKTTERRNDTVKFQWVGQILAQDKSHLLACEATSGEVFRIGLDSLTVSPMGVDPVNDLAFNGHLYYNSIEKRIGTFGGYGNFTAHNRRYELIEGRRKWVQVQEESESLPWPRFSHRMFYGETTTVWFVFGGDGNPNGTQGEMVRGLDQFDGAFYPLNDLWRLDLRSNEWKQVVGVQRWSQRNVVGGVFHDSIKVPLLLSGSSKDLLSEATFHACDSDDHNNPIAIPNEGDRIRLRRLWSLIRNPDTHDLWVFADEGVFAVRVYKL